MIHEIDVTLTDYGIALECFFFLYLTHRFIKQSSTIKSYLMVLCFFLALASILGGTVHGFITDKTSLLHDILWISTLISMGLATLSIWTIAILIPHPHHISTRLKFIIIAEFIAYCFIVLFVNHTYSVAIINYLPAVIFLLLRIVFTYKTTRQRSLLISIAAILCTFAAAGIQMTNIAIHPVYFNHNALYHVVQAIGLAAFFGSLIHYLKTQTPISSRCSI